MKQHFCTTLLLLLLSTVLIGQPSEDLKKYQTKYPQTQMVVLEDLEELHIENNNGVLNIYETFYSKRIYLSKDAGMFRERNLSFSSFTAYEAIEANTLIPNGNKYKKIKTKEYTTADDMSSGVFHDDSKVISFVFQGLQIGAQSELRYKRIVKDPHFIGRALFQDGFPVEHQVYRVIVDKDVEILFTLYQMDRDFITYQKHEEKGKVIYEWTVKDAPIILSEKWSPTITYYTPQVLPRIATYQKNGESIPVLRDVSDLFSWYETFVDTLNKDKNDPVIRAIVDSIIQESTDELDQVQRIFNWTQENIKYVAYEAGLGGFIPRSASSICQNRYGDCKDMSSTITQLLDYAGIESHLTWIGTNDIPFTYDEVPTPSVDNHMIATYISQDGTHYFMDATGRYMQFGMPSSYIQEQQALIRLKKGKFELFTIPMVEASVNLIYDSVTATITDGLFVGKAVSKFGGYYKQNLEYKLEDQTEDEKAKFFKAFLSKGNNKFLPENFIEKYPYPSPKPLEVTYDFSIGDYAMVNEDELYINLNLTDYFSGDKLKADRKTPFQFKFSALFVSVVEFTIPAGYELDYTPKAIHIDNDLLFFSSEYQTTGNTVKLKIQSSKKKLTYTVSDVTLWNKSINAINKSQKNVVILKKSN